MAWLSWEFLATIWRKSSGLRRAVLRSDMALMIFLV